ncbi:MAG: type VI secretion system ATPase TssH, partial [candidate division Zixibacteria bacterium]|nr:type VI secretion system ATPase TssH [candidate division Zixibacteria bacterium]
MNLNKFTQRSIDAITYAQQMAQAEQHPQVTPEHLMVALLKQEDGLIPQVIKKSGADFDRIFDETTDALALLPKQSGGQLYPSQELTQVFFKAEGELKQFKDEYVSVEHLLLGLLEVKSKAQEILKRNGVKRDELLKTLTSIRGKSRVTDADPESKYAVLEKYSRDLTQMAREGKLDPVIGRGDE